MCSHLPQPSLVVGRSVDVSTILILDVSCFQCCVSPELYSSKKTGSANRKQYTTCRNKTKNKNSEGKKGDCFYVTDHNH